VKVFNLNKSGTTKEIIKSIKTFMENNWGKLKHIYWDNASNFTSHEMENWAVDHNVILKNSAAYHPSGNLLAETNIKCIKRGINNIFEKNGQANCTDSSVLKVIGELNNSCINGSLLTPHEIIFRTLLGGFIE
jgi:transposase InsO family protein